jgi:16S rRNA (guanine527-N7)-methyltransferase
MSRNDHERIVERHLLESVAPAHWLNETTPRNWIDFGSGAGFPAIPLAIAGVAATWTLVESRRTKTLFLRKAIEELSLTDFVVVNDRLENLARDPHRRGAFDGFTSRATMRLGPTLAIAGPLVRSGGSAFLWKGSGHGKEMDQGDEWGDAWEFVGTMGVGSGPNVVARFIRK